MRSRTLVRFGVLALGLAAAHVSAQITVLTWSSATSGQWTTASNWTGSLVPNNLTTHDAVISATGSAYTVTASGASSLSVHKLDVTSANATLLFNFSSTGNSLSLGSATSTISAGLVEFQTGNGFFGNGSGLTTLNLSSGAQLLFSTSSATRNLNSLTLGNSGTVQATSGILSIGSGTAVNNQSGGLLHANGAEIVFQNGTTLSNSGTLRATGSAGILRFSTPLTTANLGTVDLVSGGHAYLSSTLTNTSTTLIKPGAGSYELLGGTINGGTIASGALKFTSSGGTLNGVTLAGTLTLPTGAGATFQGGTSFGSGASLLDLNSFLNWQQTGTLTGAAITFNNSGHIYVSNANSALTLDSASSATGTVQIYSDGSANTAITNQGNITHTSGSTGYLYAKTFTNTGTITNTSVNGTLVIGDNSSGYVTTNTGTITVNGIGPTININGSFDNTGGTLAATNGQIYLTGTNTTAHLNGGTIDITGGHVYLGGILDNTSATLNAPHTGQYELSGAQINGGTIASGALTFTNSNGTLNGVNYTGALSLPFNSYVTFTGGTTFSGATALLGTNSALYWQQSGTLVSKALTFSGNGYLYVSNSNSALTLDSASTATGQVQIYSDGSSGTAITNQGNITHTSSNTGHLYASSLNNTGTISNTATNGALVIGSTNSGYNTTNFGTIIVNAPGAITYLDGTFSNSGGILTATQGSFQFRGTNTTGGLNGATLNIASGAHAYLNGTLTNTSATLNAPASGQYELFGGTINSGTVAPGALTFTNSGGYLNGVSLNDNLTLPANSYVRFTNDGTSNASFTGATATFGTNAGVYWQQSGTLSGKSFTLGNGAYLYVANNNSALTLAPSTSVTGTVNLYSDGSSGTAITNQGNITHSANYGRIDAPTLNNSGTITNTAANTALSIGSTNSSYTTTNSGTIIVNAPGAITYLDGTFSNSGGILTATQGSFQFRGTNTTSGLNGATLNIASGAHAYLNGTLTNTSATLNAPASGQYELLGGTISGGTIAPNALTFTSNGGYLDGASLNDNLTLPANAYVRFTNNGGFTGATATFGANAGLYWQQSGTLSGKSFTLGNGAYLYVANTNSTLTLASSTSVNGTVNVYSDGSTGTAITNQGNLNHTANYGRIDAPMFNNAGTITNTSASTYLSIGSTNSSYATTNTGTITVNASGATTYLDGNFNNNGGTLTATQGAFQFRGTNATGNLNAGTLNIASGAHAYLNGTLTNTSVTFNAPTSGQYELYGGTITGGTIAPNALTFTSSGGYLDGASLNDNLTLPANAYVRFTNNGGNAGFTGATATFGANAGLYWQQAGTLSGKAFTLGNGAYIYLSNTNSALTLASSTSVTGTVNVYSDGSSGSTLTNQGNLTHTANYGRIDAPTFNNTGTITNTSAGTYLSIGSTSSGYTTNNTGTITVNAAGATTYLYGNFSNTGGTLTATQGALQFSGPNTTANLNGGTVNINTANGGHVYFNGTLDNTSTTLNAPASGQYELYSGTINNGSIATGALTFTSSGGTLSGVSLGGTLSLPANSYVYFTNGTSLSGGTMTFGTNSGLYWQQTGTLVNKALNFGNGSYIYLNSLNSALTLDSASTATGQVEIYSGSVSSTSITNQGNLTHTSANNGYLYATTLSNTGTISNTATNGSLQLGSTSSGYAVTNTGNITVNGSGAAIYLDGDFNNAGGTLTATNGSLIFRGTNTTAKLNAGTLNIASGAHAYLNGTLNNASATLNAPASGSYELYGGTINGGTIASGALTFTTSGGMLSGVTLLGSLNVPTSSYFTITNSTASITGASLGANAQVYWQQTGTLTNAALTFGANSLFYLSGINSALTLDPNSTATGQVQIYDDGSAGNAFTNQGIITQNTASTGNLRARTFLNSGTIAATAGSLNLGTSVSGYTFTNTSSGTVRVNGGNIFLQAPSGGQVQNFGKFDVQSGSLFTNGLLFNSGPSSVLSGAGTIVGSVGVAGGTVAPGNGGIGTLTFSSGTLNITSATTLAVEIGGASADKLVFTNPTGPVNIGAGLLSLSLTFLSPPTVGTTYNLVQITSGGSGITGYFAGLPNSGDQFTATYSGSTYYFSVNYSTNLYSLSVAAIPEPSTWALLGLGVVALAFVRRRKK